MESMKKAFKKSPIPSSSHNDVLDSKFAKIALEYKYPDELSNISELATSSVEERDDLLLGRMYKIYSIIHSAISNSNEHRWGVLRNLDDKCKIVKDLNKFKVPRVR